MREKSLKIGCNKNNETGVLQNNNRSSIFDYHFNEIKELRKLDLSISSVFKIIKNKLPSYGATYNGFYRYCKRKGL